MFWTITYYIDSYVTAQRGRSDYLVTQALGLEEMIQVLTGLRTRGSASQPFLTRPQNQHQVTNPPCILGNGSQGCFCVLFLILWVKENEAMTKQEEPEDRGNRLIGQMENVGPWPAKRCRQDAGIGNKQEKYKLEAGVSSTHASPERPKPKLSKSFERSSNTSAKGPCSPVPRSKFVGRQRA